MSEIGQLSVRRAPPGGMKVANQEGRGAKQAGTDAEGATGDAFASAVGAVVALAKTRSEANRAQPVRADAGSEIGADTDREIMATRRRGPHTAAHCGSAPRTRITVVERTPASHRGRVAEVADLPSVPGDRPSSRAVDDGKAFRSTGTERGLAEADRDATDGGSLARDRDADCIPPDALSALPPAPPVAEEPAGRPEPGDGGDGARFRDPGSPQGRGAGGESPPSGAAIRSSSDEKGARPPPPAPSAPTETAANRSTQPRQAAPAISVEIERPSASVRREMVGQSTDARPPAAAVKNPTEQTDDLSAPANPRVVSPAVRGDAAHQRAHDTERSETAMAARPEAPAPTAPTGVWPPGTEPVAQRFADMLAAAVPGAARALNTALSPVEAAGKRAERARAITLHLQSTDYGRVTIRLALAGAALSVRVSADDDAMGERLRRDRDTIVTHLRGLDYDIDVAVTAPARHPDSAVPTPLQHETAGPHSGDSSFASTAGRDSNPSPRSQSDVFRNASHADDNNARENLPADRDNGGLYI